MELVAEVAQRIMCGCNSKAHGVGGLARGGLRPLGHLGPGPLHRSTQAFSAITIVPYAGCVLIKNHRLVKQGIYLPVWGGQNETELGYDE